MTGPTYRLRGLAGDFARRWVANPYPREVYEVDPKTYQVQQTLTIDGPTVEIQDLAWDGTHVWVVDTRRSALAVDPASGEVRREIEVSETGLTGVAHDGTNLYLSGGNILRTVDPESGTVNNFVRPDEDLGLGIACGNGLVWQTKGDVRGFSPGTGGVERSIETPARGLASTGFVDGNLLVADSYGRVFTIDPDSNEVRGKTPYPATVSGATYVDGALWLLEQYTGTTYKMDPRNGDRLARVDVPAELPTGLAHDGRQFWCGDSDASTFVRFDQTGSGGPAFDLNKPWVTGAAVLNGSLWTIGPDGELTSLDPSSGSVQETYDLPVSNGRLCADDRYLWVGNGARQGIAIYEPSGEGELQDVTRIDEGAGLAIATDGPRLFRAEEMNLIESFTIQRS